jgi:hypothetical protein
LLTGSTIGEEIRLAGFSLEETTNKEDVLVKSITLTVSGSIDAEDDLADLVILADGVEIATDLIVNSDDEIIANLNYTIPAKDEVEFELRGVVTGSVGSTIQMTFATATEDIYAVGSSTKVAVALVATGNTDIADAQTIL